MPVLWISCHESILVATSYVKNADALRGADIRRSTPAATGRELPMNEVRETVPAPGWFTLAAIGALLWELLGGGLLISQALTDHAKLQVDQQRIWEATPVWMNGAWAFAVVTGIVGAVLLLTRNRRSEPLLLVSLLAALVQFSGPLLVPALRNLIGSDDLFAPFIVVVICYGVWHLARLARKSGWLR